MNKDYLRSLGHQVTKHEGLITQRKQTKCFYMA